MVLECAVCHEDFPKLKYLPCRHAFCVRCLDKIRDGPKICCPLCRADSILSPFGINDLNSKFDGDLECSGCNKSAELDTFKWCATCKQVTCQNCLSSHGDHNLSSMEQLGPIRFCVNQLDKFCTLHTQFTSIQKTVISEYIKQLENHLHGLLEEDLHKRLDRLKREKQYLIKSFDLSGSNDTVFEPRGDLDGPDSNNFSTVLNQVYRMSAASAAARIEMGPIIKDGHCFKPVPLDVITKFLMPTDRISRCPISLASLYGSKKSKLIPIKKYYGAGILDNVCDFCVDSNTDSLLVTSITNGIYRFSLANTNLLKRYPVSDENDQMTSIVYCPRRTEFIVSVLKDFSQWVLRIFNDQLEKIGDDIICPEEPKVANSWYRWLALLDTNLLLVTYGDDNRSVIWLVKLCSTNNEQTEWTLVADEENCTFRKANVKRTDDDYIIYVPDMRNKLIRTYTLDRIALDMKSFSQIAHKEFEAELPTCIDVRPDLVVIGCWRTGNVIAAFMDQGKSRLLCSVGEKDIFGIKIVNGDVMVLCKNTEVIVSFEAFK